MMGYEGLEGSSNVRDDQHEKALTELYAVTVNLLHGVDALLSIAHPLLFSEPRIAAFIDRDTIANAKAKTYAAGKLIGAVTPQDEAMTSARISHSFT